MHLNEVFFITAVIFVCTKAQLDTEETELANIQWEIAGQGCECGIPNREKRIVGGVVVEKLEYPWQAGLRYKGNNQFFCGGTLIHPEWILTAAHCLNGQYADQMEVVLGEHDTSIDHETTLFVSDLKIAFIHPKYDEYYQKHDLGLIRMEQAAPKQFMPICMPANKTLKYVGREAIVTGWGLTTEGGELSNILQEVSVPVIGNRDCRKAYGDDFKGGAMLCAGMNEGGQDSCKGDSGGPLAMEEPNKRISLIGIVSWGTGCARPGKPGVYTKVTRYLRFLERKLKRKGNGAQMCTNPVYA